MTDKLCCGQRNVTMLHGSGYLAWNEDGILRAPSLFAACNVLYPIFGQPVPFVMMLEERSREEVEIETTKNLLPPVFLVFVCVSVCLSGSRRCHVESAESSQKKPFRIRLNVHFDRKANNFCHKFLGNPGKEHF